LDADFDGDDSEECLAGEVHLGDKKPRKRLNKKRRVIGDISNVKL